MAVEASTPPPLPQQQQEQQHDRYIRFSHTLSAARLEGNPFRVLFALTKTFYRHDGESLSLCNEYELQLVGVNTSAGWGGLVLEGRIS